jgi:cytochrome c peroxidase
MRLTPAFHWALEDDDDVAPSPFGGLGWSGRASSVAEFVRLPLFDADEMNNANEAELAAKIARAPYAAALGRAYPNAMRDAPSTVAAVADALQVFLTSDAMTPFTSKYDDYVRGKVKLDPLEARGLAAFRSPDKGACNACHTLIDSSSKPERSLFTNYGYDALAVPRNRAILANDDPAHFDLGLCTRAPADKQSSDESWCVKFRTPSLRNVAVRERFMHNGAFTKLRDAVAFYATRSTNRSAWYPETKFDDVPAAYQGNVNVASLPYNRREGAKPALDDDDIDAIVAFLGTLTDAAYLPGQVSVGSVARGK